jgi:16S rRNA G527 N7-methylase RsmG
LRVTLVDRRASRVDTLQRAIIALGWVDRVVAVESDAELMSRDPAFQGTFDVVVARGFADPAITLPIAVRLARNGGWVIISEPPPEHGSRWDLDWVHSLGVGMPERHGQVVRFHVEH